MGQVTMKINGRAYEVSCDDGQEAHLRELGAHLDTRVGELAAAVGQIGEGRLLVMAAVLIADELYDTRAKLEALQQEARKPAPANGGDKAAALLGEMAGRIESLAERLQDA